jgi:hypothetical protein
MTIKHEKTNQTLYLMWYVLLWPHPIMTQINVVTFQLKFLDSMKFHPMLHIALLEPYHASTIPWIFVSHTHLLKSMVNKNMKWRMSLIHEYQMTNFNTSYIGAGMM